MVAFMNNKGISRRFSAPASTTVFDTIFYPVEHQKLYSNFMQFPPQVSNNDTPLFSNIVNLLSKANYDGPVVLSNGPIDVNSIDLICYHRREDHLVHMYSPWHILNE